MRTLEFISVLNQTLVELTENTNDHLLYVENDYNLFKKLKQFTYTHINTIENFQNDSHSSQFLIDYLNRGNFKNRIRYATIKLNEFGISKERHYFFISESIKVLLMNEHDANANLYQGRRERINLDNLIINELTNCFKIWYYPRDIYHIEFSEKRQLIIRDSQKKSWYVSNLGNYFLKLPIFEAVIFLLAIEVVLNNDKGYSKFLNLDVIEKLLNNPSNNKWRFYGEPYSLRALGVLENNHPRFQNQLSDFGKRICSEIKENYKKYNDLILFLIESESSGLNFEKTDEKLYKWIEKSWILLGSQKKSLQKSLELYEEGNYMNGLRLLYPELEGLMNNALKQINFTEKLSGLQNKAEKLAAEKIISSKAYVLIEIFKSRNIILHGNVIEVESEILKPLFTLVLNYFKKIVDEVENNLRKKNEQKNN